MVDDFIFLYKGNIHARIAKHTCFLKYLGSVESLCWATLTLEVQYRSHVLSQVTLFCQTAMYIQQAQQ